MNKFRVLKGIKILFFMVLATFVFGFLVEGLWNWLMPPLFGLHTISFWQAFGLFLLSKILFGGFHGRGGGRGRGRMWGREMKERWEGMSEEERQKFRAGMQGRRGWCSPRPAGPVG